MLCAINTDADQPRTAWVTIDASLHEPGDELKCVYSTVAKDIGSKVKVESRNGCAVRVTVPKAGFVLYQ